MEIKDTYGRSFKTLRVSLNDTCNLACTYCVDPSGSKHTRSNSGDPKKASLSNEQYIRIITVLNSILELETIRLTGGEPTLYKDLASLVSGIHDLGMKEIKMTTNGSLLKDKIQDLKNAGLTSLNISLDAIDPDISFNISKRRNLQLVLDGIDQALASGIHLKINAVVMKGLNEDQILKLFVYAKERKIRIRFLELMQMGHLYHNFEQHFFPEAKILEAISGQYKLTPLFRDAHATSKYWRTDEGYTFGIISNESDPFCNDCNRLRLDSYGQIYGCLSDGHPIHILDCLEDEKEVKQRLMEALAQKKTRFSGSPLSMLHIGG